MENRFWQKEMETLGRGDLRRLQETRIRGMLQYAMERSRFYQIKFKKAGVEAEKVARLEDLPNLPFTSRDELYADQKEHGSVGAAMCTDFKDPGQTIGATGMRFSATGKRLRVILSVTDAANQGKLAARGLAAAGVTFRDYLYIADHPQFNLLYMHTGLGSINLGSKSILIGMERAERNVRIYMELYPPNGLFTSPSYARFMGEIVKRVGRKLPLKTILGWSEPGYSIPSVREELQTLWAGISTEKTVKACDAYGMIETGYLGFECTEQKGLHAFEDSYVYEIVHPDTGDRLGPGEEGELVITHLDREGMPLIRYRTGDVTALDDSPCPCGRTHLRLKGIRGRLAERIRANGVDLYPGDIMEIVGREYEGRYNLLATAGKPEALIIHVDEARATPPTIDAIKLALQRKFHLATEVRPLPADRLLVFPHRSPGIMDPANLDWYRRELDVQRKVET